MSNRETGILVDEAISIFHLKGQHEVDLGKLPKSARIAVSRYMSDARNSNVIPDSIQKSLSLERYGIHFVGRIDQIREGVHDFEVWDVKWSDKSELELVKLHAASLVLYADAFGISVGGIINVKNYVRSRPVFLHLKTGDISLRSMELCKNLLSI